MKRRSFLALIGTAPIAAPVVAKEAAVASGITSMGSAVGYAGMGSMSGPPQSIGGDSWVKQAIARFWDRRAVRHREEVADRMARVLHPNVAALRSISPAAAYAISRAKHMQSVTEEFRKDLEDELADDIKRRVLS